MEIEKKNAFAYELRQTHDSHSLNGDPPLFLTNAGPKREKLIKSMKSMKATLRKSLPSNTVTKSVYSASKLSNKLNIKLKIKQDHQHDVTYYVKYLVKTFSKNYMDKTRTRLSKHVILVVATKILTY